MVSVVMLIASNALEDRLIVYTWSVSNSSHSISPVTFTSFPNDATPLQVIKEVFKLLELTVEKLALLGGVEEIVFPTIEMFVPAINVSWYPSIEPPTDKLPPTDTFSSVDIFLLSKLPAFCILSVCIKLFESIINALLVEFVFVLNTMLPALFTIVTTPPSRFIVIDCADELSSLKLKLNVFTERERLTELLIVLTFALGVAKLDVVIFVDSIDCVVISFAVISVKIQVDAFNWFANAVDKLPLDAFIVVMSI